MEKLLWLIGDTECAGRGCRYEFSNVEDDGGAGSRCVQSGQGRESSWAGISSDVRNDDIERFRLKNGES